MIHPVTIYKPDSSGKLQVTKRISQKQAQGHFWDLLGCLDSDKPIKTYVCQYKDCGFKGKSPSKQPVKYCPEHRAAAYNDMAKERAARIRAKKPRKICDVPGCDNPLPDNAGSKQKRCSQKCMKEAQLIRSRKDYHDNRKASFKRRQIQKAEQYRIRALKRKERGIVCLECGGPIPDERPISNTRCSTACDELIEHRWRGPKNLSNGATL